MTGDLFVFQVSSEAGSKPYLVDLLANGGIGACDCPSWQFRIAPAIARGERARCKHGTAAVLALAEEIIERQVQKLAELEAEADLKSEQSPYQKLVLRFKAEHPRCGVCCSKSTEDIHHSRGRLGSLLCNKMWWVPVCRVCHTWIHSNPAAARLKAWNGIPILAAKGEWNVAVDGGDGER